MVLLLLFTGCGANDRSFRSDDIRQIMAEQEIAWNRGDIHQFMKGYSDTICFIGSRGVTCGRDEVTANYLRSYPDQEAMGTLTFDIIEVVPAGQHHAWVSGRWSLARVTDTRSGGYSLLWAREGEQWRIVRDHSY